MKKSYKCIEGGYWEKIANNSTRLVMVVLVSLFFFANVWAQQSETVSGMVVDASTDESLPGVNIMVRGTTIGTSTDENGEYSLRVPSLTETLVISYIGYATQEVSINGRSTIHIDLEPSAQALDQVVVTALGISRAQQSLGYAVEEVSGDELNRVVQENVLNSLSGKMSGVRINSTGGAASSSVSMVIRGATSLTGDDQPLFVIDGVPVSNSLAGNSTQFGDRNVVDYGNAISDLNTSDIESVSVLKG
ncbi:MAG TPA: carboxypeptidase-like regulatory domain-containing protein, partial [Fodinibius sp.]|nr:carboxypeptidase-like regulatory domain-containing protein [Fodinibius sp.]